MAKYKVMKIGITGTPPILPEQAAILAKADAEYIGAVANTEDEVIAKAKDVDILVFGGAKITRKIISHLPKLKAVIVGVVGYDQVDVDAATDNGVFVVNNPSPDWCNEEVSNHAIALLLICAKKLVLQNTILKRTGNWQEAKKVQAPMGTIYGQTLGLIGAGGIGLMTGQKAQSFKLKVIAYDPYLKESVARENGITMVSLPELLKQSDYISIHVTLTSETLHLIGEKEINMMKPSAYLINTSRGPVIDEPALIKALQEKKIAGAALDVFEKEPVDQDNPLLKMDNVTVIPHSGSYSDEAFKRPPITEMREAAGILTGHWPKNLVNKSVKPRSSFCLHCNILPNGL